MEKQIVWAIGALWLLYSMLALKISEYEHVESIASEEGSLLFRRYKMINIRGHKIPVKVDALKMTGGEMFHENR